MLPAAVQLEPAATARDLDLELHEPTHISSLKELYSLQGASAHTVVVAPGTYRIDSASAQDFGGGWPRLRCAEAPEHLTAKCPAVTVVQEAWIAFKR